MAENKISLTLPDGQTKVGVDVAIEESNERWSDLKLQDGTTMRVKFSIIQMVRVDGEYDPDGNPMYIVKGTPTIVISSASDSMKKK